MGATAHLPSPPGTVSFSASDQEPPMLASTSPSAAAAYQGVVEEPYPVPTSCSAKIWSQNSATRMEALSVISTIHPSPSGRNQVAPDCITQAMGCEPSEGSRLIRFLPASETIPAVS